MTNRARPAMMFIPLCEKSVRKREEKIFEKIQDAVQLLNREYMQDFSASTDTKTQALQKICFAFHSGCLSSAAGSREMRIR